MTSLQRSEQQRHRCSALGSSELVAVPQAPVTSSNCCKSQFCWTFTTTLQAFITPVQDVHLSLDLDCRRLLLWELQEEMPENSMMLLKVTVRSVVLCCNLVNQNLSEKLRLCITERYCVIVSGYSCYLMICSFFVTSHLQRDSVT